MYKENDKFKEECGVFGIFSREKIDVSLLTYYGLYALQHRGQESAGIVVSDREKLISYKGMGLVSHVFNEKVLNKMKGISAIGHVRYSTTGDSSIINAQPLLTEFKLGQISIAHNGNLINADKLKNNLKKEGSNFQTTTDSEVILNLIAREKKKSIEEAICEAAKNIKGSYALVILTKDKLIGIRDPKGIRPLCLGKINNNYIICSESCALNAVGGEFIRDIEPSEMIVIDNNDIKSIKFSNERKYASCAFEYIYFAREDSVIDEIEVYSSRVLAGKELYEEHPVNADIVIGVPDSGIPAAMGYAEASGIPYGVGFVKNKYVGRTFIAPYQELREKNVSVKLTPLKSNIENKRVIVIDDSMVRGTTSKRLVNSLKKAGAKEVHFIIASPIVRHCCYLGIDTFHKKEIIGSSMNIEQIKNILGADSFYYLSLKGLHKVLGGNKNFCFGCFNGEYPF
ncbi:amidophosphoribosyltransferase [Clostridium ganghwense]|uniref:Amidophosphoribosyltransferase n=1 Tax=Clostridium ganghwense TaxID=312089 RepID=A0ABT4CQ07_9CLOT|nr:amidophosphoribosyltransferase [Clostridium ganghwense]MCY6371130.1 amidophosphoribosyltransferase [Clostridium ganghwense]